MISENEKGSDGEKVAMRPENGLVEKLDIFIKRGGEIIGASKRPKMKIVTTSSLRT